jgi:hypothetical protein
MCACEKCVAVICWQLRGNAITKTRKDENTKGNEGNTLACLYLSCFVLSSFRVFVFVFLTECHPDDPVEPFYLLNVLVTLKSRGLLPETNPLLT